MATVSTKEVLADIVENEQTEEQDNRAIAQELVDKIEGMIADRDAKCESAKTQLKESLKITSNKYLTATGSLEALRAMRTVIGNHMIYELDEEISMAQEIAQEMAIAAHDMSETVDELTYETMDQLCEKYFYDPNFCEDKNIDDQGFAFELMRLDLCRNAGPAAEDMADFYKHATEDIDEAKAKLEAIIAEYPELKGITVNKED